MERNEISEHEVKVYLALRASAKWMTNREIGERLTGVGPRTVRLHTKRLADLGILDQAEVFPAHRYRIAEKRGKRNKGYADRLDRAAEIFGLSRGE